MNSTGIPIDDKCVFIFEEFLSSKLIRIVPARSILLYEGQTARYVYFIRKGAIRLWFNNDGKDVTFQFFFENSLVASFDSLRSSSSSLFTLETIESSELIEIPKDELFRFIESDPAIRNFYEDFLASRFHTYQQLFLSRIKNNPRQRYEELLREYPDIVKRVPQHYIASYLGITPVSLSRIRSRIQ